MTLNTQTTTPRPKPNVDADNAPFWDAVQRHEFVLMQCKECGAWYWPAAYCRNHANEPFLDSLEWRGASGKGTIFTYSIHHLAFHPAFQSKLPYVYALIELAEGPMFGTNIIDCDPQDIYVGMPVQVHFTEEDGTVLPLFRPAS